MENSQVINVSREHLLSVYFYLESDGLAISGEPFDVPNQQSHLIIAIFDEVAQFSKYCLILISHLYLGKPKTNTISIKRGIILELERIVQIHPSYFYFSKYLNSLWLRLASWCRVLPSSNDSS